MDKETKTNMQYAGAIALLCEFHLHAPNDELMLELKENAYRAICDWADVSGWKVERTLDRIELIPVR